MCMSLVLHGLSYIGCNIALGFHESYHVHVYVFQDEGVVEGVFKSPEKLHLTLGVVRIFAKEEEVRIICVVSLEGVHMIIDP